MRKHRKITPMLFVAIGLNAFTSVGEASAAGIGCCMQRANASNEAPWFQVSTDFNDCKRRNQGSPDNNDNILKPLGLIWWNIQC